MHSFIGLFRESIFLAVLVPAFCYAEAIQISAGSFSMGSEQGAEDERPVRTVSVSAFSLDKNEVSFAAYSECVRSGKCTQAHYDDGKCMVWNGSRFNYVVVPQQYRDPYFPVVCVTWHQAQSYCRSRGMRLPTEAQWEYAARAGNSATFAWGNASPSRERCARTTDRHAANVGSFEPNAWGIHDMTGNVWEWTGDLYDKNYYATAPVNDPPGPEVGFYRVIRGGGWYSADEQLRIVNRNWFSPEFAEVSIGFRCAR